MSAGPPGPAGAVIAAEIERRGPIPFRDFMDLALYHPAVGYYQGAEPRIGPEGDYYTSPDLHPAFGACLGRQLEEIWRRLGAPARFDLVEVGGGKGLLARDLLAWSERDAPAFAAGLHYTSIESSKPMRARQRRLLLDAELGERWRPRIQWLAAEALPPAGILGCMLAHEFFDALPVHRLAALAGEWCEVYVGVEAAPAARFVERLGPLSTPRLAAYLRAVPTQPLPGRRLDVNLSAEDWVRRLGGALGRGYLLAIDYGHPSRELAEPAHPGGTLRAYRRHGVSADPYVEPGAWDLTSDVDFGGLARAGEAAGLTVAGFTRQSHLLAALGVGDWLARRLSDPAASLADYQTERRAIEALVHPHGLGAFRVLALARNVPVEPLRGFSLLDKRSALINRPSG